MFLERQVCFGVVELHVDVVRTFVQDHSQGGDRRLVFSQFDERFGVGVGNLDVGGEGLVSLFQFLAGMLQASTCDQGLAQE